MALSPMTLCCRPPSPPQVSIQIRFFVWFYKETAHHLLGLEAREHTAQVPAKQREEREDDFRAGRLTILYCSPNDGAGRRYRRPERGQPAKRTPNTSELCAAERPGRSEWPTRTCLQLLQHRKLSRPILLQASRAHGLRPSSNTSAGLGERRPDSVPHPCSMACRDQSRSEAVSSRHPRS